MGTPYRPGNSRNALAVLAAVCLTAWALTACMNDSNRGEAYVGSISNTCGPAGGTSVLVLIDEEPVSACGDSLVNPYAAGTRFHMFDHYRRLSDLKAGDVLTDTLECPEKCAAFPILTFEVEKVGEKTITGTLAVEEIRIGGQRGKATLHPLELRICKIEPQGCI